MLSSLLLSNSRSIILLRLLLYDCVVSGAQCKKNWNNVFKYK